MRFFVIASILVLSLFLSPNPSGAGPLGLFHPACPMCQTGQCKIPPLPVVAPAPAVVSACSPAIPAACSPATNARRVPIRPLARLRAWIRSR